MAMHPLYSMTGFALGTYKYENSEVSCEIRSLNSRYLEVYVRLPQVLKDMEDSIKERVRQYVRRGKVSCTISFSSATPILQNLKVDPAAIQVYVNLLERIRDIAGVREAIRLEHLLSFKDVLSFEEEASISEEFQQKILELVETVLQQLNQVRSVEGDHLRQDLKNRLEIIQNLIQEIQKYAAQNARLEFEKQFNRLLSLIDEQKLDRNRLELELAIISDRVDVTEELVRLTSHVKLFDEFLQTGSPVGKKLNFLLQEMHREANTISTKSTMVEISHRVVALKDEIERIREQVQNIE